MPNKQIHAQFSLVLRMDARVMAHKKGSSLSVKVVRKLIAELKAWVLGRENQDRPLRKWNTFYDGVGAGIPLDEKFTLEYRIVMITK